ncbi:ATP-dependent Clp protease adaptor protein ClpS [hydrothermal vent metagenome]|uniref:ATP-dependent Clp protease adaptor protein ClpS n=1 Tax=hydrothermal vent metagenome TaxID=652676 RepID=A0A3B0TX25_9ZZZZ
MTKNTKDQMTKNAENFGEIGSGGAFDYHLPASGAYWLAVFSRPFLSGNGKSGGKDGLGRESGTATKVRAKLKRPNLYRVLLLNDDYTPMEFVIEILREIFNRNSEDAFRIMMHVHKNGVGECGVFPYEVAETKVARVMDIAHKNQHPLQCVMEKQ